MRGREYEQAAADTETEQRDTDHQVGEVVPLDQRKQRHQQDFVSQYRRGHQGNSNPGLRDSIHADANDRR